MGIMMGPINDKKKLLLYTGLTLKTYLILNGGFLQLLINVVLKFNLLNNIKTINRVKDKDI